MQRKGPACRAAALARPVLPAEAATEAAKEATDASLPAARNAKLTVLFDLTWLTLLAGVELMGLRFVKPTSARSHGGFNGDGCGPTAGMMTTPLMPPRMRVSPVPPV